MSAAPEGPLTGVQLNVVESMEEAESFMSWLGQRRSVLSVDLETTGLDRYRERIRLIQFGDARQGWAIPWEDWRGLALQALDRYTGHMAFFNIRFDVGFLEHHSSWRAPKNRVHDVMIMAHIVDPLGPGALKTLSAQRVDRRAQAGQELLDQAFKANGWSWDTVPINFGPYWKYAALDPVLTTLLYENLGKDCLAGGAYEEVYKLEMAVRHVVSEMERNGAPVDIEYCKVKHAQLDRYVDDVKRWGKERHGISLGSTISLANKFEELGAVIEETTATGQKKVDKYQLALLEAHPEPAVSELATQVLKMRNAGKIAESYFSNFINNAIDGVVHPEIRTLGARTGRMSISSPALQQLPKGDATVRRAFIASPGNRIISTDYSQIEMRLMAHFSEDNDLIETFIRADETNGDFFVELGKQIYHDPGFEKTDKRRGLVKNTLYGKIYGAGPTKMAESAGVPVPVMRGVVDALDARYPGIKRFISKIEDQGMRRQKAEGQGYVITPFGRRLPCDDGHVYALVNYCLAPGTPILKSDLTHVPAFKIAVGDRLVGFDEHTTANKARTENGKEYRIRRLRTAVVEAVSTVRKPTLRLTLSDGRTVECSDDHLWLVKHHTRTQPRIRWASTRDLFVGSTLLSAGKPWEEDTSRGAGWLAGMYDGEGCLTSGISGGRATVLNFSQLPGPVMDKFRHEMDVRDLPYRYQVHPPKSTSPTDACVITGVFNILRTLGTLRPTRFEPRFESIYEGTGLVGSTIEYVQVVKIEDLGMQELTSIQTTTRTLIANGILSHNCLQSHAAEIFKQALVRLDMAGYTSTMMLPVHDEIVMNVPEAEIDQAISEVPDIMGDTEGYRVPLTADSEGPFRNWGEKYEK